MTDPRWPRAQRTILRVAVCYFGMLALIMIVSLVGAGARAVLGVQRGVVRSIIGVFGGPPAAAVDGWEALSPVSSAVLLAVGWCVALAAGMTWEWWKGDATNADALYRRSAAVLRYFAGVVTLVYAGFKVVNVQFPPLQPGQLITPLGEFSPMGLYWAGMSYGGGYAMFGGFAELVAGALLLMRRTQVLGALVLVGVMANVAMINYVYEIPVRGLSTNLMLIGVFLAAPRMQALWAAARTHEDRRRTWRVAEGIVAAGAAVVPVVVAVVVRSQVRQESPLHGAYRVESVQPVGAASQWQYVAFGSPGRFTVRGAVFRRDEFVTIDSVARTIRGTGPQALHLTYTRDVAGSVTLVGGYGSDSVTAVLRPMPAGRRWRLIAGFRWFGYRADPAGSAPAGAGSGDRDSR